MCFASACVHINNKVDVMADDDKELDLDSNEKKGGKGKLILIIVLAVVLLSGAVIGTLFFTGVIGGGSKGEDAQEEEVEETVAGPAIYFELKPEFVVNFEGDQGADYLQIDIQLMTRDADAISVFKDHSPLIRNNILLLLSSQKYAELRTLEGKEKMRADVLATVQQVVEAELGKPAVEAVFFTSFIMQ